MTDTASAVTDQVPEMVERVAKAMALAFHDGDWDVIPEDSDDGTMCRLDYRLMARFAIEAMREPTREMCGEGEGAVDPYTHPTFSDYDAEKVWRAMIDRALG